MSDNKSLKPLRLLSLFSGCGGMDLGFEGNFLVHEACLPQDAVRDNTVKKQGGFYLLKPNRFQTVFANDIVQEAKKAWVTYFKERGHQSGYYHLQSIVDLVRQHHEGTMVFPENIDIVTGGFPCQDFSLAGKRNGLYSHKDHKGQLKNIDTPSTETRGALYMWMKEVIEITKPKIFVAENVKGLVNLANVKDIIQQDFSSIDRDGYHVFNPMVLQAADFGVPQSRERVFFIGMRKSALHPEIRKQLEQDKIDENLLPYPKPTHAYSTKNTDLLKPVSTSSVFHGLPEPEEATDPSQQYFSGAKYMGKHCQGQIEINPKGVSPTIRSEHHGNIEFRRLSAEHGGKHLKEMEKNNWRERRLTPRECALLQTFPPDFQFVMPSGKNRFFVSTSAAYKMIGNAVPPLLAFHLARRIEKLWDVYFSTK